MNLWLSLVSSEMDRVRQSLGYCPQFDALDPLLTGNPPIRESLGFPPTNQRKPNNSADQSNGSTPEPGLLSTVWCAGSSADRYATNQREPGNSADQSNSSNASAWDIVHSLMCWTLFWQVSNQSEKAWKFHRPIKRQHARAWAIVHSLMRWTLFWQVTHQSAESLKGVCHEKNSM